MKHKIKKLIEDKGITFVSSNAAEVKRGSAFFAVKGSKYDGNDFIDEAIKNGASIVFSEQKKYLDKPYVIHVEDVRLALAIAAGIIYPQITENLISVTGTNGKSSVVSYIAQILNHLGKKSASLGTIGIESNVEHNIELKPGLTTFAPVEFRYILSELARQGINNVAFEASSHGLHQKRLGDLKVKTAGFTGFSQDHLEYHKTMDSYLEAKLTLFTDNMEKGGRAVINSDMIFFDTIKKFLLEKNIKFSTVGERDGDIKIISTQQSISSQEIIFTYSGKEYNFKTDIIGSFQATNLLIAAKLIENIGYNFEEVIATLPGVQSVKGRLQRVTSHHYPFHIFVDYAHTPEALEKSLLQLRKLKKHGKLYVIFGCGGDRDKIKRPLMGKIASSIADRVIITDDNPRSENPESIRREIVAGAINATIIGDRKKAIYDTIRKLKKEDILLIAGKGHEEYQIAGDKILAFSDVNIALESLKQHKFIN